MRQVVDQFTLVVAAFAIQRRNGLYRKGEFIGGFRHGGAPAQFVVNLVGQIHGRIDGLRPAEVFLDLSANLVKGFLAAFFNLGNLHQMPAKGALDRR